MGMKLSTILILLLLLRACGADSGPEKTQDLSIEI